MSGNKDGKYQDTNKNESSSGLKAIACIVANPGVELATTSVTTTCPKCKTVAATDVEGRWNLLSYVLCCYYGSCWWCYQNVTGRDFIPKNALHKCSSCKETITIYKSC